MASKEVMVTAPLSSLLYDRVFRVSSWRELFGDRARRWFYGGLAASWLLLGALVAGGGRADSAGFALGLPWYRYLYSQGWAIAHYLLLAGVAERPPLRLRLSAGRRASAAWSAV